MDGLRRLIPAAAALATLMACRQRAEAVQTRSAITDLVRESMPTVEQAVGLKFKREPGVEIRSRAQVRQYVLHKMDEDIPPAEFSAREAALKHFGLIPDTLNLHAFMISVLTEQIAGFYDPDSGALFIPSDADTATLRLTVISHELVHALQDQYASIDSVMHQKRENDRLSAGQAIFEGQATLAQIHILMPEQDMTSIPSLWDTRAAVAMQQQQMPVFAHAPLWVKQTLIFPYLAGGDFVRWFTAEHPGEQPYGKQMPISTSQILHPDRFAAHEVPVSITFTAAAGDRPRYQDDLGEFETRLVLEQALDSEPEAATLAAGWAGDRYAVFGANAEALVWYVAWRDQAAADAFVAGGEAFFERTPRHGGHRRPGRMGGVEADAAGRGALAEEQIQAPRHGADQRSQPVPQLYDQPQFFFRHVPDQLLHAGQRKPQQFLLDLLRHRELGHDGGHAPLDPLPQGVVQRSRQAGVGPRREEISGASDGHVEQRVDGGMCGVGQAFLPRGRSQRPAGHRDGIA
jgi:hypothetical protein